jgi:hypothetical protein
MIVNVPVCPDDPIVFMVLPLGATRLLLLAVLEPHGGPSTVNRGEQIGVGEGSSINVLIAKAQAPLPLGTTLPAGKMTLLVAVTITDEQTQWSMKDGRSALLNKLREGGIGQVSSLGRQSGVKRLPTPSLCEPRHRLRNDIRVAFNQAMWVNWTVPALI